MIIRDMSKLIQETAEERAKMAKLNKLNTARLNMDGWSLHDNNAWCVTLDHYVDIDQNIDYETRERINDCDGYIDLYVNGEWLTFQNVDFK